MPRKTGRPSSFKPEFVEQAKKLCALGATDVELADFFKVSINTIGNWKAQHPDFLGALKLGKEAADERVSTSLYQRAMGYTHEAVKIFMPAGAKKPVLVPYREHVPPDTTAMIFWLKNRRPAEWRERSHVEHTGADGGPIETMDMTAREVVERRIASLTTRGTADSGPRRDN